MSDPFSLTVSAVALVISGLTAWLTFFRRGKIKMTRPTVIYLGPDSPRQNGEKPFPKVYLRALLFADAKRGRVIESMYVSLSRNETVQNFNIWVHSESGKLVRGSGLFVGEVGTSVDHHFLVSSDAEDFEFLEGNYKLDVYAKLLGEQKKTRLFSEELQIMSHYSEGIRSAQAGLYFDWGPAASRYLSHLEQRPPSPDADSFLRFLSDNRRRKEANSIDIP